MLESAVCLSAERRAYLLGSALNGRKLSSKTNLSVPQIQIISFF